MPSYQLWRRLHVISGSVSTAFNPLKGFNNLIGPSLSTNMLAYLVVDFANGSASQGCTAEHQLVLHIAITPDGRFKAATIHDLEGFRPVVEKDLNASKYWAGGPIT